MPVVDIKHRVEDFPYELAEKVDEGVLGEVFRAFEPLLERTVALKFLRRDVLAGQGGDAARVVARRFLQEARAAARLNHPAVATIHRVGIYRRLPYVAVEWLAAPTLADRLARAPGAGLSLDEICELGLGLLDVLSAAHRAGVVHRGVKPANLFLDHDGRLRITDFGLARMRHVVATREGLTAVLYAAPEQLNGEELDARSDLYSVGAVLYGLLCGQPPHPAESVAALRHAISHEAPPRPRTLVPELHDAVEQVLVRALARRPDDRFTSARAMHEALRNATAALRAPETPATPASRPAAAPIEPVVPRATPTEIPASEAVASMLARRGRSLVLPGDSPGAIVSELVRRWPSRDLAVQAWRPLLEELLHRPPHVEAFAGGVRLGDVLLLLWDGLIVAALDTRTGLRNDAALEQLPIYVPATLHLCPRHLAERRRVVKHLAAMLNSSVRERRALPRGANLGRFVAQLARERFDGVLRMHHLEGTAYIIFSYGRCVLELYPPTWPRDLRNGAWQHADTPWLAAWAESMQLDLPDCTWRRELADLTFEVDDHLRVRLGPDDELAAPDAALRGPSRRAILRARHERNPVFDVQRWMLDELPRWCASQPQRAHLWPSLVARIERVRRIRWHHAPLADHARFDLVTLDAAQHPLHLVDRVARGTVRALDEFLERAQTVHTVTEQGGELGGLLLVAPDFEPDTVERYRSVLDAHRGGLDLLLVRQLASRQLEPIAA